VTFTAVWRPKDAPIAFTNEETACRYAELQDMDPGLDGIVEQITVSDVDPKALQKVVVIRVEVGYRDTTVEHVRVGGAEVVALSSTYESSFTLETDAGPTWMIVENDSLTAALAEVKRNAEVIGLDYDHIYAQVRKTYMMSTNWSS
jgi:hypothetical protein